MHAIDEMACATRGCDNRGKLGLNIVGHGSFLGRGGSDEVGPTLAVPLHGLRGNGQHAHGDSVQRPSLRS